MANRAGKTQRQTGVFTIEFALVATIIALFMVFISDVVAKQTMQGHLQRLSYSGVNVIKERTQLYDGAGVATPDQADQIYKILHDSMTRTMSGFKFESFGMTLEQVLLKDIENCSDNDMKDNACLEVAGDSVSYKRGSQGCPPNSSLDTKSGLFLKTSWGNPVSLFQVTLCYQTDNWFGNLVGSDFTMVKASSLMMRR